MTAASHDIREGGSWTAPQTVKNQLLYVAATAGLVALTPFARLPAAWIRQLGRMLGRVLHAVGLGRQHTRDNLARAFPDMPLQARRALSRRVYAEFGGYLGDTLALLARPDASLPIPFETGSREVLEEASAPGQGVIFASAHLGPWEHVAGSLVQHGFPLTTIARETYDPRFMRIYDRIRRGQGVHVIYRGARGSATRLVRALRRGAVLGMPMDLQSRVPSILAPFLGVPAMTAVGPARIALRTDAPVVVGTAVRTRQGNLAIRVTRIPTPPPGTDGAEDELTRRLNDEISARILEFPEGWLWMHPRWAGARVESSAEKTASQGPETR